jgi:hypothetical protein
MFDDETNKERYRGTSADDMAVVVERDWSIIVRTGFGGSSEKQSTKTEELPITYLGLYDSLATNVSCRDAAT